MVEARGWRAEVSSAAVAAIGTGHAGAAAMWLDEEDADERLIAKLRGDLYDMADLKASILDADADSEPAEREAQA